MGDSSESNEVVLDKDQNLFLDALKFVNKDSLEHASYYSGSLNGEELLD